MAGYQFIHIESYAREESAKQRTQTKKNSDGTYTSKEVAKAKKGNVSWVIGEAKREQGCCYHIENPQRPNVLIGNLDQVAADAYQWAEEARDARGRKLRKDAPCLLAGIISLPKSEEKNWEQFQEKSIEWLKNKYGANLRCVVAHFDECNPHLHYYCLANHGQPFDSIHDGKRAQNEIKKSKVDATKQEQNIAFSEAMRAIQDDFSHSVGMLFGLTRLGPRRRRLSRAAWKAEQKQAEALKDVESTAKKRHEYYKKQGIKAGQALALTESQKPARMIGNYMRTAAIGLLNGWKTMTKAELDAQRALEEDDKRREKEQAEKEKNFIRKLEELRAFENERFKAEQEKRLKAEEALDYLLNLSGAEIMNKIKENNDRIQMESNLEKQKIHELPNGKKLRI